MFYTLTRNTDIELRILSNTWHFTLQNLDLALVPLFLEQVHRYVLLSNIENTQTYLPISKCFDHELSAEFPCNFNASIKTIKLTAVFEKGQLNFEAEFFFQLWRVTHHVIKIMYF